MRAGRTSSEGFTLIEVLVAFVILAFSLAALTTLFSGSLRSVKLGEDYAHATALGRARLALIDSDGLDGIGVEAGETEDGYRWSVETAQMPDLEAAFDESGFRPLAVRVTVSWGALDNRSVTLSTIRLERR
jgi:general secretion pathway protein I